jgi:hypothetical protein
MKNFTHLFFTLATDGAVGSNKNFTVDQKNFIIEKCL